MLYDQFRAQIAGAAPDRLSEVSKALWQAFAAGVIGEAGATELAAEIEARVLLGRSAPTPRKPARVGSRPRSSDSMERRRRWAASGYMPPPIAARFTLAEAAALAVVAAEINKRGDCRLSIEHVAALAGVARSSVKRALREARALGLVTIEERRLSRYRSETNVVRIIDRAWLSWLALRTCRGGGVQTGTGTNTRDSSCSRKGRRNPLKATKGENRYEVAGRKRRRG
ncbi:transcriptional regulator [Methylobacterium gnaphalii]|uniref:Helix-turn-helix domain-containing protein n=1 Tax=Methylobacterium gnaphalii TaxID=1010610 RepID=A0A512JP71_9HYPH|nr:transcriptional regulator [Methylobacterium gnaphalii]GEP11760.1 hypothetical protein MGN01_36050 [Methylobacterium gnaphalii]GJD69436.1 hypothetical protein MMMDOFMJ_2367 [Methylobacterium gnaphalii]GLS49605.1 hypothetical protein GCM10007885_24540 [Methylobacterium gnaphalii]